MHINLIWTQSPESLAEAEWIRWLFHDFEITEYVAPRLNVFKANSVYILSSNHHPLSKVSRNVLSAIGDIQGKGLFHLSDESYSGGYGIYSRFDFVLRNYHAEAFNHPGIRIIPLGPTTMGKNQIETRHVRNRTLLWSFAGTETAARLEMMEALKNIQPCEYYSYNSRQHQKPVLDHEAFLALLSHTIFVPCPMGNVTLETFRVYESLEMGCIPILERRPWMPYYELLMPHHPLPTFSSWRKAGQFIRALSRNKSELEEHQRKVVEWWQRYKTAIRTEMMTFVSLRLKGSIESSVMSDWRWPGGIRHEMWRLHELLKHANRASLQERIGIALKRIGGRVSPQPEEPDGEKPQFPP